MLKPISEVMGARLVDLDKSQTLGEVINWVVDPDRKQISALIIKPVGIFTRTMAITTVDIVEYGPKMVVVKNQDALVPPSEIVHLPKLMRQKQRVIGSPVVTTSGKKLGQVEDLLFETSDSSIQKLYVRPGLLGMLNRPDLIIGADKIVAIERKRIVVTDDSGNWQPIRKTVLSES